MTFNHHYMSSNLLYPKYKQKNSFIYFRYIFIYKQPSFNGRITVFHTEYVGSIPTGRIVVVSYNCTIYSYKNRKVSFYSSMVELDTVNIMIGVRFILGAFFIIVFFYIIFLFIRWVVGLYKYTNQPPTRPMNKPTY